MEQTFKKKKIPPNQTDVFIQYKYWYEWIVNNKIKLFHHSKTECPDILRMKWETLNKTF